MRWTLKPLPVCLVPFGFLTLFGVPPRAYAQVSQILEIHEASITTYKPTGNTNVQGVRPLATQRGLTIDGVLRSRPGFPMAIGGNPFENAWNGHESQNSLRLDTGTYAPLDIDIAMPTKGIPWVVGRTYNARQVNSGSSPINSNGYQGKNWFQTSQPEILLYNDNDDTKDELYLVYGADRFAEYVRVVVEETGTNQYKGKNGAAGVFNRTGGSPDIWALTDQVGNVWTFLGFNTTDHIHDGQFWKVTDPDGNIAYVGDSSSASSAISAGYDGSGRILTAYDASDHRFTYAYTQLNSVYRLTQVKAETKDSGTWGGSPTNVKTAFQVDYAYYGDASHGDIGDLKQVKITTRLNDSGGETITQVKKKLYRYWEGSADDTANYNGSSNPGYPHALKYVIDFEGCRVFDWNCSNDHTFDDDEFGANDGDLEEYAAAYFEYDSSHRVRTAFFNGQCGCGGGANGTHNYIYEASGYTDDPEYDEEWATRTVVERPDGSFLTQYFDETGAGLSQAISDIVPTSEEPLPNFWVTPVWRDGDTGCVKLIDTPENLESYVHSSGYIGPDPEAGLMRKFLRIDSGDLTGFVSDWFHAFGRPTEDVDFKYDRSQTYTTLTKTVGAATVVRPLVETSTVYSVELGIGDTIVADYTTSYSYNTYSSDSQPLTIRTSTKTNPIVDDTHNGSDAATTMSRHYRKDGLVDWQKNEDDTIDYWEYTNGQETRRIQDANTALIGGGQDFDGVAIVTSPVDFSSNAGGELRWKTTTTYTSQGFRLTQATSAGTKLTYLSKLADGRLVELDYPQYDSGGPTYYGPVSYSVRNQAGKTEVSAQLTLEDGASTGDGQDTHIDESDSDPLLAPASIGSVARLRTSLYSLSGAQLDESREYTTIPGSGTGSEVTNFDATKFGYDEMGHRRRTKDPTGTITREAFDIHGRVTESLVGTNDNGRPGGESSGDDNMETKETKEFDGGDPGKNGLLTGVAEFKESGTSDDLARFYDYRGRLIFEETPTAPYRVSKYDNMGRVIAAGLYSDSGPLDETTDPTSEETYRLALTETFYDEMGRVWKTVRHQIHTDGSSLDTLESLTWYDARGRVVKVDGPELKKTRYDRLGRVTDEFVLAVDDDADYGDVVVSNVTDVEYDTVLEQRETRYDQDTGLPILEARIDRFHSDIGGGATPGALDTNADNDNLLLTSGNIKGRIQITALWYDNLEREVDRVEYGTNGTSSVTTFDRDGLSAPARSDTALRTSTAYNLDGTIDTITDPRGLVTKRMYDDAGRLTKEVKNFDSGVNSGDPYGTDDNVTVAYGYTNGLRTSLTAVMEDPGDNQVTTYIYGTTEGEPAQMKISSGRLLRAIKYPDSTNAGTDSEDIDGDADDVVSFAYDLQGREVLRQDQAGNVIETDHDPSGRPTAKRATNIETTYFDDAIQRIETTYDGLGRVWKVVQYDDPDAGDDKDGVLFVYDGWGNVLSYSEDRNSLVAPTDDEYTVSYTWEKATTGRNTVRKTGMTLPDGRALTYTYRNSSGSLDSKTSRVTSINGDPVTYCVYSYNGVGQVVKTRYNESSVMWQMHGSSAGDYPDLDRFNRVAKSRWTKDLTSDVDFYHVELTYDRDSSITSADDQVHAGFDVKYTMDDVNRLTRAEEGTLSAGSITSRTRDEIWTLSHTGNWDEDKVDLDGDDNWNETGEQDDARSHNGINELETRDTDSTPGTTGNNYTLSYSAPGELIDDGKDYKYWYDVFGRLRKVFTQGDDLVAEYRYNGLGHKIAVHEDTDTDDDVDGSDKWYYDAYDEGWRQVARFREDDTSPKEDFVNHQAGLDGMGGSSYIDLVVCRNRDANTSWTSASDGVLEERLYYCQNWRADVSAIVNSSGGMKEWVKYSAYGIPFGLPGGDTNSDGDCDGADVTQVNTWRNAGPPSVYDVRADIDLDGDVDATDESVIDGMFNGFASGRGQLTVSSIASRRGAVGYDAWAVPGGALLARARVLCPELGAWLQRDPADNAHEGRTPSLYAYADSDPINVRDPSGEDGVKCAAAPLPEIKHPPAGGYQLTIKLSHIVAQPGECGEVLACRFYITFGLSIDPYPRGRRADETGDWHDATHPAWSHTGNAPTVTWDAAGSTPSQDPPATNSDPRSTHTPTEFVAPCPGERQWTWTATPPAGSSAQPISLTLTFKCNKCSSDTLSTSPITTESFISTVSSAFLLENM